MLENKEIAEKRESTIKSIENLCREEKPKEGSDLLISRRSDEVHIISTPKELITSHFYPYLDDLVDSQLYYDSLKAECKPFDDLNQKYPRLDIDFYKTAQDYYSIRKTRDTTLAGKTPTNYWALLRLLHKEYHGANFQIVSEYIFYFYRNNLPLSNHTKSIESFLQSLIAKKFLTDGYLMPYLSVVLGLKPETPPQPEQKAIQQPRQPINPDPQQPSHFDRSKKTLIGLASIFILAEMAFGLTELLHSAKGPFAGVESLNKFFGDNHSFSISLGVVCLVTTLLILAYSAHHLIAQCCENSEENVRGQNLA